MIGTSPKESLTKTIFVSSVMYAARMRKRTRSSHSLSGSPQTRF